jgi:hypothetical protein
MSIPDFETNAELTISSANFSNTINQLKMFGDTLGVECSDESIQLNSISQESGKMKVIITIDDMTSYVIEEAKTVKLNFSLNILNNICLYSKISKEMEIHFTENYPLKIIYKIAQDEGTKIVFYLAPKISDDDE